MKETNKARQAFEDYYLMGPGRSLQHLRRTYLKPASKKPPTKHLRTLATWSTNHGWQDRVRQRDQEVADAAMAHIIETASNTGYAVFQKRIHDLGVLAERMFNLLKVGALDPPFMREFRGLLSDIAAETGGREKKHAVTIGWENDIVELLKSGKLEPQAVIDDLGQDLATELFVSAGLHPSESGEAQASGESSSDLA